MKVLDRYILTTYIKTFFSLFAILMFIFILQSVWLYIQELAGKELDLSTLGKFFMLVSPRMTTLALPLSVLLTSIMTFGNFAENYEFAAMKSTGISLQRAMRPLIIFIGALSIVAFLFANYAIPAAEYEFVNLKRNIAKLKPAMAIAKGQFNPIGNDYNIKVSEKYGDEDRFLKNVVIHKKDKRRPGNFTVIIAEEGELISDTDQPVLSLKLKKGNSYDEVYQKDIKKRKREPFTKSYFETYTINIDLSELDNVDLDEKKIDNSYSMFNVIELDSSINKLSRRYENEVQKFGLDIVKKANFTPANIDYKVRENDTTYAEILPNYSLKDQVQILESSKTNVKNRIVNIQNHKKTLKREVTRLAKFEIALHDKYVLGLSCIILFFVGAPLGAIIRKGGLGLPIVIGVILFLSYHFLGIFAKNSAEDGVISAWLAAWLTSFIMLPLGIYFTYRATTDQGLFSWDDILQPIKKLFDKKEDTTSPLQQFTYNTTPEENKILDERSINQLKDIVKNYKVYNYRIDMRNAAIDRLSKLGINIDHLKVQGYYNPKD